MPAMSRVHTVRKSPPKSKSNLANALRVLRIESIAGHERRAAVNYYMQTAHKRLMQTEVRELAQRLLRKGIEDPA